MFKVLRHRVRGSWMLLTGKGFVISKTPPQYPFVLHIGHKIEVHYKGAPTTNVNGEQTG